MGQGGAHGPHIRPAALDAPPHDTPHGALPHATDFALRHPPATSVHTTELRYYNTSASIIFLYVDIFVFGIGSLADFLLCIITGCRCAQKLRCDWQESV